MRDARRRHIQNEQTASQISASEPGETLHPAVTAKSVLQPTKRYHFHRAMDLSCIGDWDPRTLHRSELHRLMLSALDEEDALIVPPPNSKNTDSYSPSLVGPSCQASLSMKHLFQPLALRPRIHQPRRVESVPSLTDDNTEGAPDAERDDLPVSTVDDDTVTSSESLGRAAKLPENHTLRRLIPCIVRIVLLEYKLLRQHAAASEATSSSTLGLSNRTPVIDSSVYTGSRAGGRKRSRVLDDGNESQEEDDENNRRPSKRSSKDKNADPISGLLLACPFYRNDPVQHRNCGMSKITRICDLRQHLRRHHRLPLFCGRCKEVCGDQPSFLHHQMFVNCQPDLAAPIPQGWTEQLGDAIQKETLKGAKNDEKWQIIYRVLFPDDPRHHSPWLDCGFTHEQEMLYAFMRTKKMGSTMFHAMKSCRLGSTFFRDGDIEAMWDEVYQTGITAIYTAFMEEHSQAQQQPLPMRPMQRENSLSAHGAATEGVAPGVAGTESSTLMNVEFHQEDFDKLFADIDKALRSVPEGSEE